MGITRALGTEEAVLVAATPPTLVTPSDSSDASRSRTRWLPWSTLFLNPHITWYGKSNPVMAEFGCLERA
jgi:hypothetical protein